MKDGTAEVHVASVKTAQEKDGGTTLTRAADHEKEFIYAMNAFVSEHGTITDDEFFRVL